MSEHRAWGGREEGMWWPGAIAADQQTLQHQQFFQQQQQQQQQQIREQLDEESNTQQQQQQAFNYKMANSFQNPATPVSSNVTSTSPIGAAGIRGYDYSMTGGNPTLSTPAQGAQWWYPPSTMENMHNTLQSLQNSIHGMQQQQQMPPVQNPSSPHSEAQNRQEEAHRRQEEAHRQQEVVNRQHQDVVQRHQEAHRQQEVQRQHQEAQRQHQEALHQALSEAHARLQLNLQNNQLQNNHHHQQGLFQALQQHQQIISQAPLPQKGRMPRAKGDARPRGRMTAYAYFVQTCREEHRKKHPEENVVFAEFSKKCGERWKTMLDKEKKRFHEMAENDKKRYNTEMQNYTPPSGEKQRGKKRKQVKDPNAPKRSLSAFFWFSNDERGKVKQQNPEYGVGDIAKELGRRWAEADQEAKGKYEALADKDKARYEKEMTAYKKRNNPAMQQQMGHPVPDTEEVDEDDEEGDEEEDE